MVGTAKNGSIIIHSVDYHYQWVYAGVSDEDYRKFDVIVKDDDIGFYFDGEWISFDDVDVIYKESL